MKLIEAAKKSKESSLPFRREGWRKGFIVRVNEGDGNVYDVSGGGNIVLNLNDVNANDWIVVEKVKSVSDNDVVVYNGTAYLYNGGKYYSISPSPTSLTEKHLEMSFKV